jgi:hypothetical protein
MKKHTLKKLALHKETLRSLDKDSLRVAGGAPAPKSARYSECDTCGIVCTVLTCPCPVE